MHSEWKDAFASGRFVQKLGRTNTARAKAQPALSGQLSQPAAVKARTTVPAPCIGDEPPPEQVSGSVAGNRTSRLFFLRTPSHFAFSLRPVFKALISF
jgi:hypothetical protein